MMAYTYMKYRPDLTKDLKKYETDELGRYYPKIPMPYEFAKTITKVCVAKCVRF